MNRTISGPMVAPVALEFDSVCDSTKFPRIARIPRPARAADGPFGILRRRVELPASVLTATEYPARLRLTAHSHTAGFLLFVRDGGFMERYGQRNERCERSTCLYRPALEEHANEFDDRRALLTAIDLSPVWIHRLREAGFTGERFLVHSPFVQQFADRLDAELAAPDAMTEMVIEALATEVFVFASRLASRTRTSASAWLDRARRLIENEFAAPLSLSAIAAEVGVHPVHLARQFRASHGCTVGEYVRRVRVGFARRELVMTDRPVAEIAQSAGFSDHSQLTKTFKRVTGRTPAAYRATHR